MLNVVSPLLYSLLAHSSGLWLVLSWAGSSQCLILDGGGRGISQLYRRFLWNDRHPYHSRDFCARSSSATRAGSATVQHATGRSMLSSEDTIVMDLKPITNDYYLRPGQMLSLEPKLPFIALYMGLVYGFLYLCFQHTRWPSRRTAGGTGLGCSGVYRYHMPRVNRLCIHSHIHKAASPACDGTYILDRWFPKNGSFL